MQGVDCWVTGTCPRTRDREWMSCRCWPLQHSDCFCRCPPPPPFVHVPFSSQLPVQVRLSHIIKMYNSSNFEGSELKKSITVHSVRCIFKYSTTLCKSSAGVTTRPVRTSSLIPLRNALVTSINCFLRSKRLVTRGNKIFNILNNMKYKIHRYKFKNCIFRVTSRKCKMTCI